MPKISGFAPRLRRDAVGALPPACGLPRGIFGQMKEPGGYFLAGEIKASPIRSSMNRLNNCGRPETPALR